MKHIYCMVPRSVAISCVLILLVALFGYSGFMTRNAPPWVIAIAGIIMLGIVAVFGFFFYSSRKTSFELSPEGLRVKGTMYARTIPSSSVKITEVRALDLSREKDYHVRWKTNGLALPDYLLGWFRLRNRTKALMFVTDRHHVVYIPTSDGFSVLLSVSEPEKFERALKEIFPQG